MCFESCIFDVVVVVAQVVIAPQKDCRWIFRHSNPKNGMLARGHVQRICQERTSVLLIWHVSRHETNIWIRQRF